MYNEELKNRFIASPIITEGRKDVARVMFEMIEREERGWGADICTRTREEMNPVIERLAGVRSRSQKLRFRILQRYVEWCVQNKVPGAIDEISSINPDEVGMEKMASTMLSSPKHLHRFLNCICESEDEETVDVVYRCFFWLAFMGIREDDVFDVKTEHIRFDEQVIRFNGREYPIYKEAVKTLQKCVNLTQFRYKHPNMVSGSDSKWDRMPGNSIMRGMKTANSVKTMRVALSNRVRGKKYKQEKDKDDPKLNIRPSYYKVWLSGLFYRAYECELSGEPIDFSDAAELHMEKLLGKRGTPSTKGKGNQLARDYRKDYLRWKEACAVR